MRPYLAIVALSIIAASAQAPRLEVAADPGTARLRLHGKANQAYRIEAVERLGQPWHELAGLRLGSAPEEWADRRLAGAGARFYRALELDEATMAERAPDFRLLDTGGRARWLSRYAFDTNTAAVVLVFAGAGCEQVAPYAKELSALAAENVAAVRFWLIDSTSGTARSNMTARVKTLNLHWNVQVLHDREQLVLADYRPAALPEAVVVEAREQAVLYRGAIDDRTGPESDAGTRPLLREALQRVLAGQPVARFRTFPEGCPPSIPPAAPGIDYSRDVAPILKNRCVHCHSEGNIGSWNMDRHATVRDYALAMKEEIMTRRMPPWHADTEYGTFVNDFSLRTTETRTLLDWINAGAPRGEGPDPLAATQAPKDFPYGWPAGLGEPDIIVTLPELTIPPSKVNTYPDQYITPRLTSNVWLRAFIVRPTNPKLIHHAMAGFNGSVDTLGGYNPGQPPWVYPEGTGRLLRTNQTIELSLHFIATETQQTNQVQFGLYLHRERPPLVIESYGIGWADEGPNPDRPGADPGIPAMAKESTREIAYSFSDNAWLYQMHPHMHLRGARMLYEAAYPDKTKEVLLSVPMFEAHWQTIYRFPEPKWIPAGTTIRVAGAFDNSPMNPDNPAPDQLAKWGSSVTDEMFIGFIHFARTLTILTQPRSATVTAGSSMVLSVSARSPNAPITYQWLRNGEELPGQTRPSLGISQAGPEHAGTYQCRVRDISATELSKEAVVTVSVP